MTKNVQPLMIAAIGVIGVIIGAVITHTLGLYSQRDKLHIEKQADAYVDWLRARELLIYYPNDRDKNFEAQVVLNRVVVYGSRDVVNAIHQFAIGEKEKHHPNTQKCEGNVVGDVAIYQAMRRTLLPADERVSDDAVALLVRRCNSAL